MKTQTIVTEITQEDLVNLLTTATYGSNYIGIDWVNPAEYLKSHSTGDCSEDVG